MISFIFAFFIGSQLATLLLSLAGPFWQEFYDIRNPWGAFERQALFSRTYRNMYHIHILWLILVGTGENAWRVNNSMAY